MVWLRRSWAALQWLRFSCRILIIDGLGWTSVREGSTGLWTHGRGQRLAPGKIHTGLLLQSFIRWPVFRIGSSSPSDQAPYSGPRRGRGSSSGSSAGHPRDHGCGSLPSQSVCGRVSAPWRPGHPAALRRPPAFPAYAFRSVLITSFFEMRSTQRFAQLFGDLLLSGALVEVPDLDRGCVLYGAGSGLVTENSANLRAEIGGVVYASSELQHQAPAALRLMLWTLLPTDCCNVCSDLSLRRMLA
ncbi:unnamed protein product [Trichogramma brassicae]|uniref:Uncharacterized protein n=1 Tax=Trichogramma brassicae TaxID=86971 RepID=A0A6H5IM64_9HYME|nr:unnamed protein product [Trichogramma brassicae]